MIALDANAVFKSGRASGVLARFVISLSLMLPLGCVAPWKGVSPTAAGLKPYEIVDPTAYGTGGPPAPVFRQLFTVAERVRESLRPAVLPPKRSALILSGGGAYGAYTAGVLCGWTETGQRPQFDVVTGVSTGAIIAVFAFLGPEFDGELCRLYTTVSSPDIYIKKPIPIAIFTDSFNDTGPLRQMIESTITPDVVQRIAAAHLSGRRLYIGTTELDSGRPIVWDLGAIASSGKPDSNELICRLLLASSAIPGYFPSVEIPVDIDGRRYMERHVDGGLTQPLFFRPPHIPPEQRTATLSDLYYGSDEYIIVAGKLYPDPVPVQPRVFKIIGNSVTTFIHAQTRDALVKLYTQSIFTGMNYHLASIPRDFEAPMIATEFDPVEMSKMFEEGRRQVHAGTVWRNTPPGVAGGEELLQRAGTTLTIAPQSEQLPPMTNRNGSFAPSSQLLSVPPSPVLVNPF